MITTSLSMVPTISRPVISPATYASGKENLMSTDRSINSKDRLHSLHLISAARAIAAFSRRHHRPRVSQTVPRWNHPGAARGYSADGNNGRDVQERRPQRTGDRVSSGAGF